MPPRNQITARLSARSVYSKQAATKKTAGSGRGRSKKSYPVTPAKVKSPVLTAQETVKRRPGRPKKKLPISPVRVKSNLCKKNSPKARKRKTSVTFKTTAEVIESNSSEADLSSEGEETDQLNDQDPVDEVVQKTSKTVSQVEVSQDGNEVNEEESSGEEGDIEDIGGDEGITNYEEEEEDDAIDEENDSDEKSENIESAIDLDDEELAIAGEIDENLDDSDENVCYSFPEPSSSQSTANVETANSNEEDINDSDNSKKRKNKVKMNEVQLKKKQSKEEKANKRLSSNKRKVAPEKYEEVEEEQNEVISFQPKKKKKKLPRANLPVENDNESFSSPGGSRVPSFSSPHLFNPNRPSTSSFRSSAMSPHPHIDSIDSLIRFNKSVPCGNVASDQAFRWLISPTLPVDFFHNMFEKMPFTVQRDNHQYYKDLFSGNDLNAMLKEHNLEYGVHIDVVKYVKGMRIPVSADGRAYYSNVWEDYKQGFSLRVRNPQAYNKNLWKLCTLLQEYFSSSVGCNIYLTPPKAQGFPPHYDDIDAFIVQVEGRKYWKVYAPRYPEEDLARYSSKDFSQNEIGNPILQVCLNAGEMLYIPRGYIHQAATDGVTHSLHLTFSTNQLNTWGDLLLIAASRAVEKAILSDVAFRESVSKDYMDYIGSAVSDSKAFKRYELLNKVKDLAKKAMSYIDVDEAADHHSMKFIQSALPPIFNKIEKEHSLHGNGSYWKNGDIRLKGMIELNTEIQLIKKRVLRLVIGDSNPRLYHTLENLRDPRPAAGEEPLATYVEFEMEGVPSYLFLLNKFPDFVKVKDLPLEDPDDKISFATSLYENGLIMTKDPLPREHDDEFDWSTIPDIMPPIKKERS